MPEGFYWIYAIIDDGTNQAVDYSPGYIEIKHPQISSDFTYYSKSTEEDDGDGDEIIESGESFDMEIRIRNESYDNSYNLVSSTLTTTNPNVTITDNDSYYGDFSTREARWGDNDFDIQIAIGFVGDVDFDLNLEFRDADGYEYYQVLDIPDIHISGNVSPAFEVIGIQIVDDGSKCNNDGILNSGETSIEYKLQIRNKGAGKAIDVYCEAQPFPSEFKTEISSATYPDIPSGSAAWTDPDDHFILHEIPADFAGIINAQVNVFWADRQFNQLIPFNIEVQPAPWLNYYPKTSDFGIKALGNAAIVPVTLTNYGSSDIIISQIEDLSANSNNWITGATFPITISPGTSTIIGINIQRDNPENVNETFRIHSNIHNGITQDIVISGSFYNPLPQGYKKLWESGAAGTDDCNWIEPADLDGDGLIDLVMYDRNEIYFWEQKSINSFEFEYKYTYIVPGLMPSFMLYKRVIVMVIIKLILF